MTHRELLERLRVRVHGILLDLLRHEELDREKLDHSQLNQTRLKRDHRDSRLDRLVAELIAYSPPPANLRLPPPRQDFALCATES